MNRTFLTLTVIAMAGFISVAHADKGAVSVTGVAPPQSKQLATIEGKGKIGEACHAVNGVGDKLNDGLYSDTDMSDSHKNEHTWCCGPGSSKRTCFNCDNDRVTCTDGKAQ
jgi:hypothetical protein